MRMDFIPTALFDQMLFDQNNGRELMLPLMVNAWVVDRFDQRLSDVHLMRIDSDNGRDLQIRFATQQVLDRDFRIGDVSAGQLVMYGATESGTFSIESQGSAVGIRLELTGPALSELSANEHIGTFMYDGPHSVFPGDTSTLKLFDSKKQEAKPEIDWLEITRRAVGQ